MQFMLSDLFMNQIDSSGIFVLLPIFLQSESLGLLLHTRILS